MEIWASVLLTFLFPSIQILFTDACLFWIAVAYALLLSYLLPCEVFPQFFCKKKKKRIIINKGETSRSKRGGARYQGKGSSKARGKFTKILIFFSAFPEHPLRLYSARAVEYAPFRATTTSSLLTKIRLLCHVLHAFLSTNAFNSR